MPLSVRLVRSLPVFLALALAAPAAAQVGVYRDDDPAEGGADVGAAGGSIRITGTGGRQRMIPPVYTVRQGDTLWDVTGRFYGSPWEWPRVWSYNPEITNPHWIYPLDQLRLVPPGGEEEVVEQPTGLRVVRRRPRPDRDTLYLRQEGFIDPQGLQESGVISGSPEDHMLLAPYDTVYIEFEDDYRGTPRGEMTVFREVAGDERVAEEQGSLVRLLGTVRIDSYDAERRQASATILEAVDPIERGFRVAQVPRRFELVPPQVADRTLESRVVATLRPRVLLGERQLVFLPVGSEQGVRRGYRFFLTRLGDRWRESFPSGGAAPLGPTVDPGAGPEEYPAEIVAEGRVVDVQPESCALMITEATAPVQLGDRAELREGY